MRRIALPERPHWRDDARALGFGFHEMYGEPYWLDGAAYLFSMEEIERDIEGPSQELHEMCLELVGEVAESEGTLARLAIPEGQRDLVRESWRAGDRHLYGRFDLAYDGTGPAKLLEYNADTPTSIFEAAHFQHDWLIDRIEAGDLPEDADQLNLLQESLVEAFGTFDTAPIFHFACWTKSEEDRGTATYLMDCAVQAGHRAELHRHPRHRRGCAGALHGHVGARHRPLLQALPLGGHVSRTLRGASCRPGVFVEPAWKAVLSNKAMLALLWERHPGHPNLLPTYLEGDPAGAALERAVSKPFFSREGENVTLLEHGAEVDATKGDYGAEPRIHPGLCAALRGRDRGQWTGLCRAGLLG